MKNYDIILFDLDGTLTDPRKGITKSFQYALNKLGIPEVDCTALERFIGPPIREIFASHYSLDDEKVVQAIDYFHEYFIDKGMFENVPFPGIEVLLQKCFDAKKKMLVATSKPTVFSEKILKHFGLLPYFEGVFGSNIDGTNAAKAEIIARALSSIDTAGKSVVMIGDRIHDIDGAQQNGIDSIGVLYGFGSREEIEQAKPTHIRESIQELITYF